MNPATGIWSPDAAWRLQRVQSLGAVDGDTPDVFGGIIDIEVDDDGTIYVLDALANLVRAFDASGAYVRSYGRRGEGPGEFRMPTGLALDQELRLWVADYQNARFTAFDSNGQVLQAYHHTSSVPWRGGLDKDGRILDYASRRDGTPVLVRISVSGAHDRGMSADSFALPEFHPAELQLIDQSGTLRASMPVPFTPLMVRHIDPRGYLWWGINDRYRFHQQAFSGDTLRIVEREFEPTPVTEEDIDAALESTKTFVEQGGRLLGPPLPSTKPAFKWITVDSEGFIWVHPHARLADQRRALHVFDPDGRFLGEVRADFDFDSDFIPVIRNGLFYTTTRDSLGVQRVVTASITGRRP